MIEWTLKYIILVTATMIIRREHTLMSIYTLILLLIEVGIWLIIKDEQFIGVMLILIYVGAIAILFIFVVMMVNIKEKGKGSGPMTHWGPQALVRLIVYISMIDGKKEWSYNHYTSASSKIIGLEDINMLSNIIMNEYGMYVIEAAMLLLLVMIGVIKIVKGHS